MNSVYSIFSKLLLCLALSLTLTGCSSSKGKSGGKRYKPTVALQNGVEKVWTPQKPVEPADAFGTAIITEAQRWLGTPYVYGGHTINLGTDCSGLVMEVYGSVCSVKMPRSTTTQREYCKELKPEQTAVGDLLFFAPGGEAGKVSHVGIYIGEGKMIHASSSKGVIVSRIDDNYWGARFLNAGRPMSALEAFNAALPAKKSKRKKKEGSSEKGAVPCEPVAPERPVAAAETKGSGRPPKDAPSIDLLDLIIDQKVDSIFSDRFMD